MSRLAVNRAESSRTAAASRRHALGHGGRHAGLLRLQRDVGNRRVGRMLMRQAVSTPPAQSGPQIQRVQPVGPDELLVLMADGSRYRIRRRRRTDGAPVKPRHGFQVPNPRLEPPSSNPRLAEDNERRFVELDSRLGKLRGGAYKEGEAPSAATGSEPAAEAGDPFAAQKVLKAMQDDMPLRDHLDLSDPVPPNPTLAAWLAKRREELLKSGGKAYGPMAAPDNFSVKELANKPFVELLAQHEGWRFSASGSATVSGGSVSSPTGKASVGTGPIDVGGEVGYTGTGHRALGSIIFTPGRRDVKPAAGEGVAVPFEYDVVRERDVRARVDLVPAPPRSGFVPESKTQQRYLYFRGGGVDIDPLRSKHELELLDVAIQSGYEVTRVEAFTSPEGSLDRRGRFPGNRALAQERARAAATYVRKRWPGAVSPDGDGAVTTVGGDELYGTSGGGELAGGELVAHAVEQFRSEAAEAPHRTHELLKQLERARSSRQQAELIYPLLRRAVITLTQTTKRFRPFLPGGAQFVEVPAHTERERVENAPPDVLERAGRYFLFTDSLPR